MTEPIPWDGLYSRVKSQIPAAPDALIRQEISAIMMDFTADTNIFVEEIDFTTNTTDIEYPLVMQNGGRPNRLMLVFDPSTADYHWADGGISMRVPGIIRLARVPSEAKTWRAVISKACGTPQMDTSVPPKPTGYPEVEPWIVDKYVDTLYYGVMWLLQRMPAKPFRDPKAAAENSLIYSSGKASAKVNNQYANVYNAAPWHYPQGFRTVARKGWV